MIRIYMSLLGSVYIHVYIFLMENELAKYLFNILDYFCSYV